MSQTSNPSQTPGMPQLRDALLRMYLFEEHFLRSLCLLVFEFDLLQF